MQSHIRISPLIEWSLGGVERDASEGRAIDADVDVDESTVDAADESTMTL